MPTTPTHALPFPDDEDWVNQGAYSIEQLATRLDDVLADDAGLVVGRSDADQEAGGLTVVAFTGPVHRQEGWAFDGTTFTYSGSGHRTFLLDVEVTMRAGGVSPSTTVEVRAGGVSFAGSYDALSAGGTVLDRNYTHRITTPVRLTFGNALDVVAAGGTVDSCGLRIYPVGAHT